jgi:hypothetical protein
MSFYTSGHELTAADLGGLKDGEVGFTATWTGGGAFNKGSSVVEGKYYDSGSNRHIIIQAKVTTGGAFNVGTGVWSFGGFPAADDPGFASSNARPVGWWWVVDASGTSRAFGPVLLVSAAGTSVQLSGNTPTFAAYSALGSTYTPGGGCATDDLIVCDFWVPAAP